MKVTKPYKLFLLKKAVYKRLCIYCKHCIHDDKYMCGLYRDKVADQPIYPCSELRTGYAATVNLCGYDGKFWEQREDIEVYDTQEELDKAYKYFYNNFTRQ